MEQIRKIKIVITHSSKLSERWRNYYCLDDLKKKFDVEYWDCSSFTYPNFSSTKVIRDNYSFILQDIKEFESRLKLLPSDTLMITDIHFNKWNYQVHKIQSKYFKDIIQIVFFSNNILKESDLNLSEKKNKSLLLRVENVYLSIMNKVMPYMKTPIGRLYLKKTKKLYNIHIISCANRSYYRINHPDYDSYLKLKNIRPSCDSKYILFLDNYFPYHSEIKRFQKNFEPEKIATDYYLSMNTFFQKLENYYGCDVIIAAHPTAQYTINPFEGRKIIYGKTAELVKCSFAVCLHNSNSISFAIMYDKPLTILHNKAYRESKLLWPRLPVMANLLGIKLVDTDLINRVKDIFSYIDKTVKDKYVDIYLHNVDDKCDTPNSILFEKYFIDIYMKCYNNGAGL